MAACSCFRLFILLPNPTCLSKMGSFYRKNLLIEGAGLKRREASKCMEIRFYFKRSLIKWEINYFLRGTPIKWEINSILKIVSLIYFVVSEINILTKFRWAIRHNFIVTVQVLRKCMFFDTYAMKNNLRIKMQITYFLMASLPISSWPVRISILSTCVM